MSVEMVADPLVNVQRSFSLVENKLYEATQNIAVGKFQQWSPGQHLGFAEQQWVLDHLGPSRSFVVEDTEVVFHAYQQWVFQYATSSIEQGNVEMGTSYPFDIDILFETSRLQEAAIRELVEKIKLRLIHPPLGARFSVVLGLIAHITMRQAKLYQQTYKSNLDLDSLLDQINSVLEEVKFIQLILASPVPEYQWDLFSKLWIPTPMSSKVFVPQDFMGPWAAVSTAI